MPDRIDLGSGRGYLQAKIDTASSGAVQIVAAQTGKSIVMTKAVLVSAGTTNIKWQSGSTDLTGAMPFVANLGMVDESTMPENGLRTNSGEALNLNNSATVQVSGYIKYFVE